MMREMELVIELDMIKKTSTLSLTFSKQQLSQYCKHYLC